ncbi:MAG: hypothetical protein PHQ27_05450, partial [Victivallales bacterium]|nr:hypothetical protein [Victivallales bacterium]
RRPLLPATFMLLAASTFFTLDILPPSRYGNFGVRAGGYNNGDRYDYSCRFDNRKAKIKNASMPIGRVVPPAIDFEKRKRRFGPNDSGKSLLVRMLRRRRHFPERLRSHYGNP